MGLTKGQWTRRSDFDPLHSKLWQYSNWRALPKQAGLLRCEKSCRLRWINYLRPDGQQLHQDYRGEQTMRLRKYRVCTSVPSSSSSDHSSVTNTSITTAETNSTSMIKIEYMDPFEIYPVIDENSWSEPQVVENSSMPSNYLDDLQFPFPSADTVEPAGSYGYAPDTDDDMKFWHNFFVKSQGIE